MSQTVYNHPKDLKAFATLQGVGLYQTPITSTAGEPVATDAFLCPDIKIDDEPPQLLYDDMIGKTGRAKGVLGMRTPGWEIPATSLRPSGTAGTAPDMEFLFRTGLWENTVYGLGTATTIADTSTTTVLKVTSGANLTAYEDVITVANANGELEFALVTEVDETATPDEVTVTPPLSFAAASNAAVGKTITYRQADDCEEPAFDLTRVDTHEARKASGCFADSMKWAWGSGEPPKIEASGPARSIWKCGTTTVGSAYTAGGATLTVDDHKMFDVQPDDSGSICINIAAEGANAAENVRVTNRNASTGVLTVEDFNFTTLDESHAEDAVVTPYAPAPTYTGEEIPAKTNKVRVGITTTASEVLISESGSCSWSGGVAARVRGHGDAWTGDGFNLSRDAEVTFEAAAWSKTNTAAWAMRAIDMEERPVCINLGGEGGKCCAAIFPRTIFQPFGDGSSGGAEDFIAGTLSGKATATQGTQAATAAQSYIAFG